MKILSSKQVEKMKGKILNIKDFDHMDIPPGCQILGSIDGKKFFPFETITKFGITALAGSAKFIKIV